jgi:alpha-glucosidase (family GH31 glycosyl hydrolase)
MAESRLLVYFLILYGLATLAMVNSARVRNTGQYILGNDMDEETQDYLQNFHYTLVKWEEMSDGLIAHLVAGFPDDTFLSETNPVRRALNLRVLFIKDNELTIELTDVDRAQWQLPKEAPYPHDEGCLGNDILHHRLYRFSVTKQPFSLKIMRIDNGEIIFNTATTPLLVSKTFTVFGTQKASEHMFGLGERTFDLGLTPGTYTVHTADKPACLENGTAGHGTYGHHPYYLMREKSGNFHLVLVRNTVPMDITISEDIILFKMVHHSRVLTIMW